jgi:hypothetical protein
MEPRSTAETVIHSAAKNAPVRYDVVVSCNKCGGTHEAGISVALAEGPLVRQSIGDLWRGKILPKSLSELAHNSITCPTTGRQSNQRNYDRIFLVPPQI